MKVLINNETVKSEEKTNQDSNISTHGVEGSNSEDNKTSIKSSKSSKSFLMQIKCTENIVEKAKKKLENIGIAHECRFNIPSVDSAKSYEKIKPVINFLEIAEKENKNLLINKDNKDSIICILDLLMNCKMPNNQIMNFIYICKNFIYPGAPIELNYQKPLLEKCREEICKFIQNSVYEEYKDKISIEFFENIVNINSEAFVILYEFMTDRKDDMLKNERNYDPFYIENGCFVAVNLEKTKDFKEYSDRKDLKIYNKKKSNKNIQGNFCRDDELDFCINDKDECFYIVKELVEYSETNQQHEPMFLLEFLYVTGLHEIISNNKSLSDIKKSNNDYVSEFKEIKKLITDQYKLAKSNIKQESEKSDKYQAALHSYLDKKFNEIHNKRKIAKKKLSLFK